jgi:hypothetical protein
VLLDIARDIRLCLSAGYLSKVSGFWLNDTKIRFSSGAGDFIFVATSRQALKLSTPLSRFVLWDVNRPEPRFISFYVWFM